MRSLLVTTDQICAAIQDIFQDTRSIAEPAGALAVAGIKKYVAREGCTGRTLVAINGGANMNFDRLRYVAERADSARSARRCWRWRYPRCRDRSCASANCSASAASPNSTIATANRKTAQLFVGLALEPGQGRA